VLLVQDVSGSIKGQGISRVQLTQIQPLIDMMLANGGELGFGIITEQVPPTFLRLVCSPPVSNVPNQAITGNVFARLEETSQRKHQLDEYNKEYANYGTQMKPRIQKFKEEVNGLLKIQAKHSYVTDTLRRAEIYFAEQPQAKIFLLLISDFQDNSKKTYTMKFPGNVIIYVVSANGSLGILEPYRDRILVFESIDSAITAITQKWKGENHEPENQVEVP